MTTLRPSNTLLDVKGRLAYNALWRAWNTIYMKKEIIDKFPDLKNRKMKVGYRMILYRDMDGLKEEMKRIEENDRVIPILLYFKQDDG